METRSERLVGELEADDATSAAGLDAGSPPCNDAASSAIVAIAYRGFARTLAHSLTGRDLRTSSRPWRHPLRGALGIGQLASELVVVEPRKERLVPARRRPPQEDPRATTPTAGHPGRDHRGRRRRPACCHLRRRAGAKEAAEAALRSARPRRASRVEASPGRSDREASRSQAGSRRSLVKPRMSSSCRAFTPCRADELRPAQGRGESHRRPIAVPMNRSSVYGSSSHVRGAAESASRAPCYPLVKHQ